MCGRHGRRTSESFELAPQCIDECKPFFSLEVFFQGEASLILLQDYRYIDRTYSDVAQALAYNSGFSLRTDVYSMTAPPPLARCKASRAHQIQRSKMVALFSS